MGLADIELKAAARVSVFLLSAVLLFAQADANKGQITGTVYDAAQAVVPNAKITVKNSATEARRQVTSGSEGQFRAALLDPGSYDVVVNAQGFAPAELRGVVISVGAAINLPVTLEVRAMATGFLF
jgi:Carboxypeptidase regulatory-like domain